MNDEDRWRTVADALRVLRGWDNRLGDAADKLDPPKRKRVVYVNVCEDFLKGTRVDLVRLYDSRSEADCAWSPTGKGKTARREACIRVELEEGRFDE